MAIKIKKAIIFGVFIIILVILLALLTKINFKDNIVDDPYLYDYINKSQPNLFTLYLRNDFPTHNSNEVLIAYDNTRLIESKSNDSLFFFETYSLVPEYCNINLLFDSNIEMKDVFDFCSLTRLETHILAAVDYDIIKNYRTQMLFANTTILSAYSFISEEDALNAYREVSNYYTKLSDEILFDSPVHDTSISGIGQSEYGSYMVAGDEIYYVHVSYLVLENTFYHIKSIHLNPVLSINFGVLNNILGREYLHRMRLIEGLEDNNVSRVRYLEY